ncbi:hypothetical protein BDV93DRAFT_515703 [Ceratobasidium sp. AG-I]|nr:hypothetical protein BDV93DRAFT_515703 [Ceratobasidium sp. AG-I]
MNLLDQRVEAKHLQMNCRMRIDYSYRVQVQTCREKDNNHGSCRNARGGNGDKQEDYMYPSVLYQSGSLCIQQGSPSLDQLATSCYIFAGCGREQMGMSGSVVGSMVMVEKEFSEARQFSLFGASVPSTKLTSVMSVGLGRWEVGGGRWEERWMERRKSQVRVKCLGDEYTPRAVMDIDKPQPPQPPQDLPRAPKRQCFCCSRKYDTRQLARHLQDFLALLDWEIVASQVVGDEEDPGNEEDPPNNEGPPNHAGPSNAAVDLNSTAEAGVLVQDIDQVDARAFKGVAPQAGCCNVQPYVGEHVGLAT